MWRTYVPRKAHIVMSPPHLWCSPSVAFEIETVSSARQLLSESFFQVQSFYNHSLCLCLFPAGGPQFDVHSFVSAGCLQLFVTVGLLRLDHLWWFLCPATCLHWLVIHLGSYMSRVIDSQECLRMDTCWALWPMSAWTSCFHFSVKK